MRLHCLDLFSSVSALNSFTSAECIGNYRCVHCTLGGLNNCLDAFCIKFRISSYLLLCRHCDSALGNNQWQLLSQLRLAFQYIQEKKMMMMMMMMMMMLMMMMMMTMGDDNEMLCSGPQCEFKIYDKPGPTKDDNAL